MFLENLLSGIQTLVEHSLWKLQGLQDKLRRTRLSDLQVLQSRYLENPGVAHPGRILSQGIGLCN